jgi:hypothetical protein
MNINGKYKNMVVNISWLVMLLYAVASAYLLISSLNWVKNIPTSYLKPEPLIAYAVTSFLLVALAAVYHLSSLVRRRRRRTDRQRLSRAKFIRAKHRRSQRV